MKETIVNGRICLTRKIDLDYVDPKSGLTNRQLMEKGRSPIDSKTGQKIELHHMSQDPNGPFAELLENSEHGNGNNSLLHPSENESWRKDPQKLNAYQRQKKAHWKNRVKGE